MPRPFNLYEFSAEIGKPPGPIESAYLVCPKCHIGSLRLHVRVVTVHGDVGKRKILVPQFLACTRKRSCGWWKPTTEA